MVELHLYGKLRNYSHTPAEPGEALIIIEPRAGETLGSLFARLAIPLEEINLIFYNSRLLATRNKNAELFDLPQVSSDTDRWNLNEVELSQGDRIGIFGKDMSILSM